jgi:flagellar hook protein FlgE
MLTALNTALTALNAETEAVNITGNNLANLNTTAYKTSSAVFDDLVSQSLDAEGTTQIGMGVQTPTTSRNFAQGTVLPSTSQTDVAIQGNGFLIVKTESGQVEYTRAGNLTVNKQGQIQTATGEAVQGWTSFDANGNVTGPIGNIQVATGTLLAATPTTQLSLNANLNATATSTTPAFSTPIPVYDSLGRSHSVSFSFSNTGSGTWNWSAAIDGQAPPTPNPNSGTLTFDGNGNLTQFTQTGNAAATVTMTGTQITGVTEPTLNFAGLPPMEFDFFTQSTNSAGTSTFTSNLTQYDQPSDSPSNSQNGNAAGQFSKVSIGDGGVVLAQYSNGQQVAVGQLAMANFVNPSSLIAVGNNNYQTSSLTSNPGIGIPNTGGRGDIQGGALEASTVDIATEFTHLMTYQNSYQAASRVITTSNTILQQTINLIQG